LDDIVALKNLLDFFILSGVDENIQDVPVNHCEKTEVKTQVVIKSNNFAPVVNKNTVSSRSERLLEGINDLESLNKALMSQEIDLKSYCMHTVCGRGVENPDVLVLGDMPNADTDKSGIAFSGNSGQLLEKMLASIGLSDKTNTYLAYLFPYKTPGNRLPTFDELVVVLPYVKKLVKLLKPAVIISLNVYPANTLTGASWSLAKNHGEFMDYQGAAVVAIYDPELLLIDASKKALAWEDLKKISLFLNNK
jgi:DNA polymerase